MRPASSLDSSQLELFFPATSPPCATPPTVKFLLMAAARVFRLPELLEAILLQLDSTEVSGRRDELDDEFARHRRYRRTERSTYPDYRRYRRNDTASYPDHRRYGRNDTAAYPDHRRYGRTETAYPYHHRYGRTDTAAYPDHRRYGRNDTATYSDHRRYGRTDTAAYPDDRQHRRTDTAGYPDYRRYRRTDTAAPPPVPQLFALQRVNRDFQATIVRSKDIQRKLNLEGTIHKYYDRHGDRRYSSGMSLQTFDSVLDKKILYAYQSALAGRPSRGDSWKTMKINDPKSKVCAAFWFAGEDYETDANTTLGGLLEWEMGVEAQRTAEYGEKDSARPIYKARLELAKARTA